MSIFTTSLTETGRSSKQRLYVSPSKSGSKPMKGETSSRSSSMTSLHTVDTHSPSPVDNPENTDHLSESHGSRKTLKTDSEGN